MNQENLYRRGRIMYIGEATFEYLISILVAGSYLATLTKTLGISDSLTGIISSFISLGCLFQMLSMLLHRRRMKPFIVLMSVINQLLFMLLYIIPLTGAPKQIRIVLFVIAILSAYLIYNICHPKKIGWLMSLVDDNRRGRFTANKEIVSLVIGMAFSFGMGTLVDYYRDSDRIRTAFIICAITIFILMLLHTVSMLLTPEPTVALTEPERSGVFYGFRGVFKDKNILRVTVLFILWNIASYSALPFYGTYQINELGFSLQFVSVLTICSSLVRVLVSRLWGVYADRRSFARMIRLCFAVMIAGFLCAALAVPANGRIMFTLYNICHGIALGGINSALINLVFDYAAPEKRADSLALCQAVAGLSGFLATLAVSPLITLIQQNGNRLFGLPIYAQQAASIIGLLFTIIAIIYVKMAIITRQHKSK